MYFLKDSHRHNFNLKSVIFRKWYDQFGEPRPQGVVCVEILYLHLY